MAETLRGSAAVMDALLRLANGRALCNCGEAYQDEHGGCRHGCSANVLAARDEMAAALCGRRAPAGEQEAQPVAFGVEEIIERACVIADEWREGRTDNARFLVRALRRVFTGDKPNGPHHGGTR